MRMNRCDVCYIPSYLYRLRAAFGIREDRPAGAAFSAMNDKGKKGEEKVCDVMRMSCHVMSCDDMACVVHDMMSPDDVKTT